jgi:CBS domain-containing protein
MITDVFTLPPEMGIMRAIYVLCERDLSGAPVVDENDRLLGFLTERDFVRTALQSGYFDEETGCVADFMTRAPLTTVGPEDSLIDVGQMFIDSPVRRAPVIENGRLIGVISRRDVLKALTGGSWFVSPERV